MNIPFNQLNFNAPIAIRKTTKDAVASFKHNFILISLILSSLIPVISFSIMLFHFQPYQSVPFSLSLQRLAIHPKDPFTVFASGVSLIACTNKIPLSDLCI